MPSLHTVNYHPEKKRKEKKTKQKRTKEEEELLTSVSFFFLTDF